LIEIGTIWFGSATALALFAVFLIISGAFAQEPVEMALVRGHFSEGSGVWRADDFGWFYYDLDKGQGGEELKIDVQGRLAEKGHIVYSSSAWPRQFEFEPWGSYQAIAFFGKPYLAGYPESNFTSEVSSLGKGELREILLDTRDTYTLTPNSSLPLKNGYILAVNEISKGNDVVEFVLLKNGKPVHAAIVSIGGTYVYKIDNLPVILVHLADAMSDGNSGFAEVDGIFQVSDEPDVKLFEGGRLGNLELTDLSEESIEFRNQKSLTLIKNGEIPLTDGLALRVIDSNDLVYYPEGGIYDYGVHVVRGPTFNGTQSIPGRYGEYYSPLAARWNFENYSAFYMDPEKQSGSETLVLHKINGRTVLPPTGPQVLNGTLIAEGFQYTAIMEPRDYNFKPWGHYYAIPFLGELWFAGYDDTQENNKTSLNLLDHEKISRVLIDSEIVRGNVVAGNYSLQEGYEVRIRDVEKDKIFVQLFKNGILQDSSVVNSNSTYIYKKDLDDVADMPIIKIHINSIFSNGTFGFATIDGIFQISDQLLLPVEPGLGIGKLQIRSTPVPYAIIMANHDTINLNRDSTIALAPNMNIRVADNDTLRYYLYTTQYVVPAPKPPLIKNPGTATSSTPVNFTMIVPAAEIRRVTADILDSNNRTIWAKDLTSTGMGSRDLWMYSWNWSATSLRLSDDGSLVLDANGGRVPGFLYLNKTSPPAKVDIKFDPSGRIASILGNEFIYYISPGEYSHLNTTMSYDEMLANDTQRHRFIKIEPERSILQFMDVVNGRVVPSSINHTLKGTLEALEPHAVVVGTKPGRYELRLRVENAINAIQAFGEFLNVTRAEMRGVSIGSAMVLAGDAVSVPLEAPAIGDEKRINISYNPAMIKATDIKSECKSTWQIDSKEGKISVLLPEGCGAANLTFMANQGIKENITTGLNITSASGFKPDTITNGTITIVPNEKSPKKSDAPSFLISALAVAFLAALVRRRV
jgi:S-layer protein (TIGR01567 family)